MLQEYVDEEEEEEEEEDEEEEPMRLVQRDKIKAHIPTAYSCFSLLFIKRINSTT
jgi:hypothetical protein